MSKAAYVLGNKTDPFLISAMNRTLHVCIDGKLDIHTALPIGMLYASDIASIINSHLKGLARDDGYGRLIIRSGTKGSQSEIRIYAENTSVNNTLGIVPGVYVGSSNYYCPYCGKQFDDLNNAKLHEASCPQKNSAVPSPKTGGTTAGDTVEIAPDEFAISNLPLGKSYSSTVQCPICGELLDRKKDVSPTDGKLVCWKGCWKED